MICYRDRTYCAQDTCAHAYTCERYLTKEIEQDAKDFGLPVAIAMFTDCYSPLPIKTPTKQGAPNAKVDR